MRDARLPVFLFLLPLLCGAAVRPAEAAGDPAPVASASVEPEAALDLLRRGELAKAAKLTTPSKQQEGSLAPGERRLLLVHAVALAAQAADSREDDAALEAAQRVLGRAKERARPEDLPLLRSLEGASPKTAPYARSLARAALGRIGVADPPGTLIALLKGDDVEARVRALAALGERLARAREKVLDGGDLDAATQAEVADPGLIAALIDALRERAQATDSLAHDQAALASPSALHALALVEAPAIPALEAAMRRSVPGAEAALAAVVSSAAARVQRYPRSSWSSAQGTLPVVVPGARTCAVCLHALPDDGRFCTSCGAAVPVSPPCPRCGANLASGICPRCGAVAGAEPRRCERCGEVAGVDDRFCRRCGAKREGETPPK